MGTWKQINRYFPTYTSLIGLAYARWLNLRRAARYLLGHSHRQWRTIK